MVKFLSGNQYDGELVPVCTYWRNDLTTNPNEDFATLIGTGDTYAQQNKGQDSAIGDFAGQCIANAFFAVDDITCFNQGRCNTEGKCLPCSKYIYGGMRMAISHSPPLDILRTFAKGATEAELQSPNLAAFPPGIVNRVDQDQLPYHIILRNIQAEISKCCHWNAGDGLPSRFFLSTIFNGPDTREINDVNGNPVTLNGIIVTHPEFPDRVGTFFPVGTVVVAGFEDQPSFYLEPRTGVAKPGDDIIFSGNNPNSPNTKAKSLAATSTQLVIDSVQAAQFATAAAAENLQRAVNFEAAAQASNNQGTIDAAEAQLEDAQAKFDAADAAASEAEDLGQDAVAQIVDVVEANNSEDTFANAKILADTLDSLADQVEITGNNAGGESASELAAALVNILRERARNLRFAGFAGASKCEFFFESNNVAEQWNSPEDGSLPCNGVRTDCKFYTGEKWKLATDEKMSIGRPITGDQLQEVRFRSDDWPRFDNPEQEFENRFSTPFIWAFKGYVDVGGQPDVRDMELYRPNLLFGRDTSSAAFETLLLQKIEIINFDNFEIRKRQSRAQPGSDSLNKDKAPSFPSIISQPSIPTNTRLKITHPRRDERFVYRTWSPDKNTISLFGEASGESTIYIVNNTALQNRNRYHTFLGTKNFVDVPTSLPRVPSFGGVTASQLRLIFESLEEEQALNSSVAPLGFHRLDVNKEGFWESINVVDLVHNRVNDIFVFLLIDEVNFIFDSAKIDYRFLHSIVRQTNFKAKDFTPNDPIGSTLFGLQSGNIVDGAIVEADAERIVGEEEITIDQFYFGWRFKDRNIQAGTLQQPLDLQGAAKVADTDPTAGITFQESPEKELITQVGYNVIQYRKEFEVKEWYVLDSCGRIMLRLEDTALHRVLPLPNQQGDQVELTDVLVNGGGTGSVVAQWALEKVTLNFDGEDKELGQVYRDLDGLGLPANYVIVGPKPGSDTENAFGRPETNRDSITVKVTFLRAQSAGLEGDPGEGDADARIAEPELSDEVVKENFYNDQLLFTTNDSTLEGNNFTAGSENRPTDIQADQQDYVFVFSDSEGRPIGRKVVRFMCMYSMLAVLPVEIQYKWRTSCVTYALFPDFELFVGNNDGQVNVGPRGTTDPDELTLGFRLGDVIGDNRTCISDPSCGDHENLDMGPLRVEFETIVTTDEFPIGKVFYPSAGQAVPKGVPPTPDASPPSVGVQITTQEPGTQFLRKRGPLWYPYTICERPRYGFKTGGPLNTDSTELLNVELGPAGLSSAFGRAGVIESGVVEASPGVFGGAVPPQEEAYRGPDLVKPRVIDVHPSLRSCTSAFTYANTVVTSANEFRGYARVRGELDTFWYEDKGWVTPPFGNRGRNQLIVEITEKRGDYVGGSQGKQTGFRWMPMFPERDDLGAGISLFSEELEPQHYRLLCATCPAGVIDEVAPTRSSPRYTHKALIFNRALAGIEYPFFPYYPTFLPDDSIGKEPEERGGDIPEGSSSEGGLTTMWAWREQERPIRRGFGTDVIDGLQLQSPDYIIDNRRLEVRLRPEEGTHIVRYRAPRFNLDGEITRHASLQLDSGPPRFFSVDFINQSFQFKLAQTPGVDDDEVESFYDTSKILGDAPFTCVEGTKSDNLSQFALCSCETNTQSENVDNENLPARFLHLDEIAPEGTLVLYESEEIQTPFLIDLVRAEVKDPCCVCSYYMRGLFFSLNTNFLPRNRNIDPAFDSRFTTNQRFIYTWSRVPHGFPGGEGDDGRFNSTENLADDYIDFDQGEVFVNRFVAGARNLNVTAGTAAFFPSTAFALENQIAVKRILPTDPKLKGGIPVNDAGFSQGQDESIVLDMAFDTYVKIREVIIRFVAGAGFQVPRVRLTAVAPVNRVGEPVTLRTSLVIGESTLQANGTDIPNAGNFNSADIRNGEVLFTTNIVPSYSSIPFWNQFAEEFQLVFDARSSILSMGIASIELRVDALLSDQVVAETIQVRERKYYASTGTPAAGENPESHLGGMDSASAYWRTAGIEATEGGNRFRANAFGQKLTEDGPIERGDPRGLERRQSEVYNDARDLLANPYTWVFESFSPLDEAEAVDFYGGRFPNWTLNMSLSTSSVDEISRHVENPTEADLLYGKVPKRAPWNAPGHAWTFDFVEGYKFCCSPCPQSMVIDFNYAHLHDGLKTVETARFWDELPSGFTKLFRSTMISPDPTFGQQQESGILVGGDGGTAPGPVLLNASAFLDSQGNPISDNVLANSAFRQSPEGDFYIFETGGE